MKVRSQLNIFDERLDPGEPKSTLLDGFSYKNDLINKDEEDDLVIRLRELTFREFEFHGYFGKRRVVSFGWRYEFTGGGGLKKADDIPDFLLELRKRVAKLAQLKSDQFQHVLVTEYSPGAGIGWHRDKAVFGEVVGVSLLSQCVLRFRKKAVGDPRAKPDDARKRIGWDRVNITAQPRSAYLLTGPARSEWEHSILRVDDLRYSITFRTMSDETAMEI